MTTAEPHELKLYDEHVDSVSSFNFLGAVICDNADCGKKFVGDWTWAAARRLTYLK